jgi:2'-5' RNA ligase
MRLFIAVDLEELKDYLIRVQEQLPKENSKLTLQKRFHLTLKFLGEVSETNIEKIDEKLKKIRIEPFSINLDDIGVFPNKDYIRVIWIDLNPKEKIIELQQKIDSALGGLFEKDTRFHPHITLARARFIKDKIKFINSLKKIKIDKNKGIMVKQFRLVKSTLTPKGPIYEDLKIFEF